MMKYLLFVVVVGVLVCAWSCQADVCGGLDCGAGPCCLDQVSGAQCYDATYTCLGNNKLCVTGNGACGIFPNQFCYDVTLYSCQNGALVQTGTSTSSTTTSTTSTTTSASTTGGTTTTGSPTTGSPTTGSTTGAPHPVGPIVCTLFGDPHLTPFNPKTPAPAWEKVPGNYKLANFNGGNKVEVSDVACTYNHVAVACTQATSVQGAGYPDVLTVSGDTVKLQDGTVVPIKGTGTAVINPSLSIKRNGVGDYTITVPGGTVHVSDWSITAAHGTPAGPFQDVTIKITNPTDVPTGACGSINGPNVGLRKRTALTPAQFWQSWRILDLCDSIYPFQTKAQLAANTKLYAATVYPDSPITTTDLNLLANATALCAPLLSGPLVSQCSSVIDASGYYQSCLDDVILSTLLQFAANSINSFATTCATLSPTPIVLPAAGGYSTASGPGLSNNLPVTVTTHFTIVARDVLGNQLATGGDSFTVSNSEGPTTLSFVVVDNANGTYTVSYTATVIGSYTIDVLYRGVDAIQSSPFTATFIANGYLNFLFDGLAATIVGPSPFSLVLLPLAPNDINQQWTFVNGFITSVSQPTYVFDITGNSRAANSPVGVYPHKSSGTGNQQWVSDADGSIESQGTAGFYLKHVSNGGVDSLVADYDTSPEVVTIQPAAIVPSSATSATTASATTASATTASATTASATTASATTASATTASATTASATTASATSSSTSTTGSTVTYAPLSTASGPGLAASIESGDVYSFTVQAKTQSGANRVSGGDTLTVTIGGFATFNQHDNGDGTYTVTYEQDQIATFTITVKLNGVSIQGSPFSVAATD